MRVNLDYGFPLKALVTNQACQDMGLRERDEIVAVVKAPAIHLVPHHRGFDSSPAA
jgi:molybdate transport system ATP-binding protein